MLITEIDDSRFLRTFTDTQCVNVITEYDPIYCIEVQQLTDIEDESTSAYILLCWINVLVENGDIQRFGECICSKIIPIITIKYFREIKNVNSKLTEFIIQEVLTLCKFQEKCLMKTYKN